MAIVDFQGDNPDPNDPRYRDFPTPSGPIAPTSGLPNPPKPGGAMYDGDLIGSPEYVAKIEKQLKEAGGQMYDPSDLEGFIRNATNNQGEGWAGAGAALQNQLDIYKQRDPTNSYGLRTNEPRGSGGGGSPAPSPSKQFSDPLSSFLEDWANRYAGQLENPPAGSGRSLLENALQQIAGQFQKGGFTPAEQEVFQTQALDPLERLRSTRKQQVMEELSRRGIDPKSGVALSMLQDVDRQFDSTRAQTQRSIAGQGAQETTQRMLQAVQLLSGLAGSQDQRMNQAFNYRSVPYNLSNNAFNQSMQFAQMNNPLSLIQPLLALSGQQQQRSDNQGAALADLIWALTRGL